MSEQPKKKADIGNATITGTLDLPGVVDGVDAAPDNPLARALRNLLERGQRFRHLAHAYFRDPAATMRWFGIFIETDAGRVLFFPGFAERYDRIVGRRASGAGKFDRRLAVDHVSIESNLESLHFTSARSVDHQRMGRTLPIEDGAFLCFGMTISSVSILRPVRKETVASSHVPAEHGRTRLETFVAARDGAEFQVISMNGSSPWRETAHFAVAVGPRSGRPYEGPRLALPEGSPFLRQPAFSGPVQLPVRCHSFPLSPRHRIHVISTWLPVDLTTGVTFTGTPNS